MQPSRRQEHVLWLPILLRIWNSIRQAKKSSRQATPSTGTLRVIYHSAHPSPSSSFSEISHLFRIPGRTSSSAGGHRWRYGGGCAGGCRRHRSCPVQNRPLEDRRWEAFFFCRRRCTGSSWWLWAHRQRASRGCCGPCHSCSIPRCISVSRSPMNPCHPFAQRCERCTFLMIL